MALTKNIFHQTTFYDIEPCTFYFGIDPTAPKLHIGHYYMLRVCEHLVDNGFEMILLLGDATAKIGDPTDKSRTRSVLDENVISKNMNAILDQLPAFRGELVYNSNIPHDLDIFKHFSVSNFLTNKTFKERLENNQGLSLLELMYPAVQAYDFYYLRENYDVKLQIGGQDQWFNMVTGLNLISRLRAFDDCHIATLPLITTNKGEKIGKTSNNVELDAWGTWQFFRNIRDENIQQICMSIGLDKHPKEEINDMKVKLANEMVSFIYSAKEAEECHEKAKELFKPKR